MLRLAAVLIPCAFVIPACDWEDDDDDDVGVDDDDDDDIDENIDEGTGEAPRVWTANLIPLNPSSPFAGDAVVRQNPEANNVFQVDISTRNDVYPSNRPWHVHFGACGSGGGIVGLDQSYPRLVTDFNGTAQSSARIAIELDENDVYHVNVHESDAQFSTIIACGNLVRTD